MGKRKLQQGIVFNNGLIQPISFDETQKETIESANYIRNTLMNDNTNSRLFDTETTKNNTELELIGYFGSDKISVLMTNYINDEPYYFIKHNCKYDDFSKKNMSSPYEAGVYNVGYMGDGNYGSITHRKYYKKYEAMFKRCIGEPENYIAYNDVIIDPMWYNFQNFAEWCNYNYYEFEGETMTLDKDLMVKGSRIYSPLTCCILPEKINLLIRHSHINDDSIDSKTLEKVFLVYKKEKEDEIKKVANIYMYEKGGQFIPQFQRIYNALINYNVEISDIL